MPLNRSECCDCGHRSRLSSSISYRRRPSFWHISCSVAIHFSHSFLPLLLSINSGRIDLKLNINSFLSELIEDHQFENWTVATLTVRQTKNPCKRRRKQNTFISTLYFAPILWLPSASIKWWPIQFTEYTVHYIYYYISQLLPINQ